MEPQISRTLDRLDNKLLVLFNQLSKHEDQDLNRQPKPGEWSVLQVMQHLRLVEKYAHQYIEKKLSFKPTLRKGGIVSRFKTILLHIIFKIPVKIKAPELVGDKNIPLESSFWDVSKQWKQEREDLRNYLDQLPNALLAKEIFKHPQVGRTDAAAMLVFFDLHFNRHLKQIDKIMADYKY